MPDGNKYFLDFCVQQLTVYSMCTDVLLKQQRNPNEFFKNQLKYICIILIVVHSTENMPTSQCTTTSSFITQSVHLHISTIKVRTESASYVCYIWFLG